MNDTAPRFPIGADSVGVLRHLQTVADRKSCAGLLDHLSGFVERIDRKGDDIGVLLFKLFEMRLVVGNLPNTVRSPDAAIKENDRIVSLKIGRELQTSLPNDAYLVFGKFVTRP